MEMKGIEVYRRKVACVGGGGGSSFYDLSFTALVSRRKWELSGVTHSGVTLCVRGSSRSNGCSFPWPQWLKLVI